MAMSSTMILNSFALAVRLSRTCIIAKDVTAENPSWPSCGCCMGICAKKGLLAAGDLR